MPNYEMGCKRMLSSDDFYAAINRDNVEVITHGIQSIDDRQVIDGNGTAREVDIIVYATGFDVENQGYQVETIGPDGRGLRERFGDRPRSYMGALVPGLPNMYSILGPNTGVGTASVVHIIECQLKLIMQCIQQAGMNQLIEVKPTACAAYNAKLKAALDDTVWAGSCKSWYKREDGDIVVLYPGNARDFAREHEHLRLADVTITPISRAALTP